MAEWLYYNSAAGSLHTKKLRSRLCSTEIELYVKENKKSLFGPLFGALKAKLGVTFVLHL